jgi:hypothetical protein
MILVERILFLAEINKCINSVVSGVPGACMVRHFIFNVRYAMRFLESLRWLFDIGYAGI